MPIQRLSGMFIADFFLWPYTATTGCVQGEGVSIPVASPDASPDLFLMNVHPCSMLILNPDVELSGEGGGVRVNFERKKRKKD